VGRKTVELRRIRPQIGPGDLLILYETRPTCAIVAQATIEDVLHRTPRSLWLLVGQDSGLARSEFLQYFQGCSVGWAIRFCNVVEFDHPVSLATIREVVPRFAPPQSYHYLRTDRTSDQGIESCLDHRSSPVATSK
jgi:predicted transcriptional regulator